MSLKTRDGWEIISMRNCWERTYEGSLQRVYELTAPSMKPEYVISENEAWLPGVFKTFEAAEAEFRK